MKVLTISRNYPSVATPRLGPWVEGLVRALSADCEERVVAPVPYAPPFPGLPRTYRRFRRVPRCEVRNGIEVLHPRFLTGPGYSWYRFESLTYTRRVCREAGRLRRSFPFDLIHAHFAYPDGVAAARLGRRFGVPVVISEHALWKPWMDRYPLVRRRAVRAVNACRFQIAASRAQRDSIVAFTHQPEKVRIVPIGYDPAVFHPDPRRSPEKRGRILFVGRLQHVKGFDLLLRALPRIAASRPDASLAVVGGNVYGGGDRDAAEARRLAADLGVADRVSFLGTVQPSEVADRMRESSVLVVSSRRENFSAVLVEALACGTPVVATRCGGPQDIVDDSVGVLVQPEDVAELAAGVVRVLDRLSDYDPARLSAYARERFTWQSVAGRVLSLYEEALENETRAAIPTS